MSERMCVLCCVEEEEEEGVGGGVGGPAVVGVSRVHRTECLWDASAPPRRAHRTLLLFSGFTCAHAWPATLRDEDEGTRTKGTKEETRRFDGFRVRT